MGNFTAKLAIDRKLRKELMENYDLIEVVNKGRYYTAKAYSKSDKKALFQELTIEKFPSCVKEKGTTTYVVLLWIGVLRFFRNMGWSKIGPSGNGNIWKLTSFGSNPDTPLC